MKSSGCGPLRLTAMWMPAVRRWSGSLDVKPDDSVAWLATLANSSRAANRTDRVAQSAMSAIAFHRGAGRRSRSRSHMARDDAEPAGARTGALLARDTREP